MVEPQLGQDLLDEQLDVLLVECCHRHQLLLFRQLLLLLFSLLLQGSSCSFLGIIKIFFDDDGFNKMSGHQGCVFRILTNISLDSLPQMIWNFSCSTLFLIFSFVHGSWFISDVRVWVSPKFISINDNSDQFYKRVVYKFLTRKVLRHLHHVLWNNSETHSVCHVFSYI